MLYYIIELDEQMPTLAEQYKIKKKYHKRLYVCCVASASSKRQSTFFKADSNTAITKGLISSIIRVLSGQTAQEIVQSELFFIKRIGMPQLMGSQRSSGLANMNQQIRVKATHQLKTDQ